jgi:type I restriction-modification system DNA methylase subunit
LIKITVSDAAVSQYVSSVTKEYRTGKASELSYRSYFKSFIESTGKEIHLSEEQKAIKRIGRPDFTSFAKSIKNGYIETKDIPVDLDQEATGTQLTKYLNGAIPNIILTNYLRFMLIRNSRNGPETILDVSLLEEKELKSKARASIPSQTIRKLEQLLQEFYDFTLPTITNASELATELAKRTRLLGDLIQEQLDEDLETLDAHVNPTDSVYEFYLGFSELINDKDEGKCVDAFAETITYGLFLARLGASDRITRANAANSIPTTIKIIKKIFINIAGDELPSNVAWIVEEIIDVLNASDIKKIVSNFNFRGKNFRDPFTHFYEDFLQVYNPKMRKQLGVYYTPEQVVSFITRSVNKRLKSQFGKQAGLASGDITLLDPCTGTGTFLAQSAVIALDELRKHSAGAEALFIKSHLLKDFFAFEISVSPYVISHLKLSLLLERENYVLSPDERLQIYLTNTLDPAESTGLGAFMGVLSAEVQQANRIKLEDKIMVIVGNPPYYKHSSNRSPWILGLTDSYKKDLKEQRLGNLDDDYVKFLRFAQWKLDQNNKGILGFITNNSFIDNTTFRAMRKSLLASFNKLYILNLHGDSNLKETAPDGGRDENVFDIKQGVSISLFIKEDKNDAHEVFYHDKYGERAEKFEWLDGNDVDSVNWIQVKPDEPYYLFKPIPISSRSQSKYQTFFPINKIFSNFNSGVETKKDAFVVAFTKDELMSRLRTFTDMKLSDQQVKEQLNIDDIIIGKTFDGKPKYEWQVSEARMALAQEGIKDDLAVRYLYRPFDYRQVYFSPHLISRMRNPEASTMLKDNISICVSRQTKAARFTATLVADGIIDLKYCEYSRGCYFFPLYSDTRKKDDVLLGPFHDWEGRQPNFTAEFTAFIAGLFEKILPPQVIFYYIYAILYSTYYRTKFNDLLRIDFPRIPFVSDGRKFEKISNLGRRLADVQLGNANPISEQAKFLGQGTNTKVEFVGRKGNEIWINPQKYFDGITDDMWTYTIGNYPVMSKWLKYRVGRDLSYTDIQEFLKTTAIIRDAFDIVNSIDRLTSGEF